MPTPWLLAAPANQGPTSNRLDERLREDALPWQHENRSVRI